MHRIRQHITVTVNYSLGFFLFVGPHGSLQDDEEDRHQTIPITVLKNILYSAGCVLVSYTQVIDGS